MDSVTRSPADYFVRETKRQRKSTGNLRSGIETPRVERSLEVEKDVLRRTYDYTILQ